MDRNSRFFVIMPLSRICSLVLMKPSCSTTGPILCSSTTFPSCIDRESSTLCLMLSLDSILLFQKREKLPTKLISSTTSTLTFAQSMSIESSNSSFVNGLTSKSLSLTTRRRSSLPVFMPSTILAQTPPSDKSGLKVITGPPCSRTVVTTLPSVHHANSSTSHATDSTL